MVKPHTNEMETIFTKDNTELKGLSYLSIFLPSFKTQTLSTKKALVEDEFLHHGVFIKKVVQLEHRFQLSQQLGKKWSLKGVAPVAAALADY